MAADNFRTKITASINRLDEIVVKYAIQINSAPWRSEGCETAYQFIRAALGQGHEIMRVFFYYDGAYNGLRWMSIPACESVVLRYWTELAVDHGVDLVICVAAAQRRGLLEKKEAVRLGERDDDLAEGFRIGGLGLWVEACLKSDRFLEFGA